MRCSGFVNILQMPHDATFHDVSWVMHQVQEVCKLDVERGMCLPFE